VIGHIVRKEILNNLRSIRVVTLIGICLFLGIASILIFTAQFEQRRESYQANEKAHAHRLENAPHTWWLYLAGYDFSVPPPKLSIFSQGLSGQIQGSYRVKEEGAYRTEEAIGYQNPILGLFFPPDFLFLARLLGGLMALLVVYDCLVREREEGTLLLLFANALPRHSFLLGKWLGNYLIIAVAFPLALVLGILLSTALFGVSYSLQELGHLGLMGLFILAYLAVFCSLGLLISVSARSSSTALLMSLAGWVLLSVVLPGLGKETTRSLWPVPASGRVESQRYQVKWQLHGELERALEAIEYDWTRTDLSQQKDQMERKQFEKQSDRIWGLTESYLNQLNRQEAVLATLSRLTPGGSLVHLNTGLAQSGQDDLQRFRRSVWAYHRDFTRYCLDKMAAVGNETSTRFDDLPHYSLPVWNFRSWMAKEWVDVLLLLLWNVLFFLIAFVRFLRVNLVF